MARLDQRRLEKLIAGFRQLRLLVVGDVMLDEYLWGDVERVSPEAPVPVVHVKRESLALGGAGNVVRNVVAMGAECVFCAVVGHDWAGDRVIDLLKDLRTFLAQHMFHAVDQAVVDLDIWNSATAADPGCRSL